MLMCWGHRFMLKIANKREQLLTLTDVSLFFLAQTFPQKLIESDSVINNYAVVQLIITSPVILYIIWSPLGMKANFPLTSLMLLLILLEPYWAFLMIMIIAGYPLHAAKTLSRVETMLTVQGKLQIYF